ncbi:cupin domain-containing protein [Cystobacter fuscus]|uniref:cupin domain-containing protein n=1 Tax=Cystobacter fuscus TaxID=43 RepID=UPI002B3018E5|nr:cupin domain-containing protein [Cystobacter fuscus]
MSKPSRPSFIRNYSELPAEAGCYPGETELMSVGTPLSRPLGLSRLGIHHELVPPGTRTSWPHAEELEEEFVFVLEGHPDVWLDGELHRAGPGDAIAFTPGTGIAHTLINNTDQPVRLLVIGESLKGNRIYYPLRPEGFPGMRPERHWSDAPKHPLGPHDGLPDASRPVSPDTERYP